MATKTLLHALNENGRRSISGNTYIFEDYSDNGGQADIVVWWWAFL